MSGAAIGIICKAPQPGRSKTRLAAAIGVAAASELSACFLRDVAAAIEAVPEALGRRGYGVYAPAGAEDIMRQLLPAEFGLLLQAGDDLGHVLIGATRALLLAGHDCVLLVNGDSPTLPPRLLAQAIEALRAARRSDGARARKRRRLLPHRPETPASATVRRASHGERKPSLAPHASALPKSGLPRHCFRSGTMSTTSKRCVGCMTNCSAMRPAFAAADLPRRAEPSSRTRRR